MKVLVLGLPRTGTQSIADALVELGIGPVYHMREVGKNNHQAMWLEAIEAKFEGKGKGKPWAREDFERILSGYEAVADFPAAIFPAELIAAYPEATVVLSTRDPSSWHASMSSTLWHHHSHRPAEDPSPLAPLARKYHAHCWGNDFPANGLAFFYKHEALIREARPGPGGLLEFRPGDGWVPLCTFLGAEVPKVPFPRNDDWAEYKKKVNVEADGVEEA